MYQTLCRELLKKSNRFVSFHPPNVSLCVVKPCGTQLKQKGADIAGWKVLEILTWYPVKPLYRNHLHYRRHIATAQLPLTDERAPCYFRY